MYGINQKDKVMNQIFGQLRTNEFRNLCENVTPCVYASIAIALNECGMDFDQINSIFARSQELWEQNILEPSEMTQKCYDMTGIDVRVRE